MSLDFLLDQFQTKCELRTSQASQKRRPLDIVVDQFQINCEERTSFASQIGRPLDIDVDQFEINCEERIHKIIKEEGLLISFSTSSKPGVNEGLHK